MLLAQKGYKVVVVDKAGFPSDTVSTHYIHQPGVAALKRWGLLDTVIATNCPPIRNLTFDVGPFALKGSPAPAGDVADAYAPRRTVLDKILVDAAAAAGAEVREHFSVNEILMDGDRVTGIRGHAAGGAMVNEHARIVIGADGLHSMVARSVQAPTYHATPTLSCTYYGYFSDVEFSDAEMHVRPDRQIIGGATHDGQILVIAYWPQSEFHEVRSDIEGHFMKAVDLVPEFAEKIRGGRRTERFRGSGDLPNHFRKPFGPGWALVGDAGYHKSPITAQGITDAFRDAELLTTALDDAFSGHRELEEALASYEATRNQAAMPLFDFTVNLAALAPPPLEMQQLFGALIGNQEQINRFFGVIAGTVPVGEFFSPENIGMIMGERAAA
jgi:2-polyprenyl-6-methoxyphenol hydroxylase-like FAD-dependent oxidoreductase